MLSLSIMEAFIKSLHHFIKSHRLLASLTCDMWRRALFGIVLHNFTTAYRGSVLDTLSVGEFVRAHIQEKHS